jgi:hypothetical protein
MRTNISYHGSDSKESFGLNADRNSTRAEYIVSEPFVRFAYDDGKQAPELRRINEPIPSDAQFASPIYFLNRDERTRQAKLDEPYAVSDSCIAKHLQEQAETERREYYPIYVESDAQVPLDNQITWIREFCRENLQVNPSECTWYFSGGRSIHCHVPKLARQNQLNDLKELAKESQYQLDPKIYEKKRQFRLPGATHSETGLPKIQIKPGWEHDRIIREATTSNVSRPETYAEVLADTFGPDVLNTPENHLWDVETDSEAIDPSLNEWETHSWGMGRGTFQKWKAHYSQPVSPYANAGDGDRSLLVAKTVDGAFAEKRETHSEDPNERPQIFVPCDVFAFFGCNREFTVTYEHRPVRLSIPDYEKFTNAGISDGDFFVLIGGKSRSSILHTPGAFDSKAIAGAETFNEAIETLELLEYESGASERAESHYNPEDRNTGDETRAGRLQRKAETEGIDTLSHGDRILIANRLLKTRGVDGTREWFQEQYGDEFDREGTNRQLRSICAKYEDLPEFRDSNVTKSEI